MGPHFNFYERKKRGLGFDPSSLLGALLARSVPSTPRKTIYLVSITHSQNAYAREDTLPSYIHVPGPTFLLVGDNAHAFPNNMIVTSIGK